MIGSNALSAYGRGGKTRGEAAPGTVEELLVSILFISEFILQHTLPGHITQLESVYLRQLGEVYTDSESHTLQILMLLLL